MFSLLLVKFRVSYSVTLIKQHLEKLVEIPEKRDFLTWSIKNLVRKVKQFVTKYYIN